MLRLLLVRPDLRPKVAAAVLAWGTKNASEVETEATRAAAKERKEREEKCMVAVVFVFVVVAVGNLLFLVMDHQ